MSYESSKKAQEYYKVGYETLRRWSKNGQIQFQKTKGGHRRYFVPSSTIDTTNAKESIIYSRVSSQKQKNDLQQQINYIKKQYPQHNVISDIGSGINFKRKGFLKLFNKIIEGEVKEIVVANKDRLARFDFSFIEFICKKFGCQIKVISKTEHNSSEELVEDLLTIITVFTSRYYGLRSHSNKNKKNKILSKPVSKGASK